MIGRILTKLSTRPCHGNCRESDPHSDHLTFMGKRRLDWWLFKHQTSERAQAKAARMLPRWLVYRATIRLGAEVTTGPYSSTVVPELRFMDAIQRWYDGRLPADPVSTTR